MPFTSSVEESIHNSDNESVTEEQSSHDSENESESHHGSQLYAIGELLNSTKQHYDLQKIALSFFH